MVKDCYGFELLEQKEIKEYRTVARLYRHNKSGAQVLSLCNDDENKVFGITFRTPPSDSTGVAHILEHSVLCGSRKYPVKEPFVELLKGSLQTFLNAFTYPDKTCYPVASQNLKDFHNLIDVYLDAVFHPLLDPFIFKQEGWHIEAENEHGPFKFKGVVYNEMKGAYSSPDNLLSTYSLQSLFPDNPYSLDSGGHPKEIPNLTYEQFKAFHEKYYHPSNARIYFYGDDDEDTRLRLLNEYLKDFDPIQADSLINPQSPFDKPRTIRKSYVVDENSDDPKAMVTCNWVLGDTWDVEKNFSFRILEYILLGMPGSPLRKALIESALGEDIAGGGLGTELRQIYFSTGLKGVKQGNEDHVVSLINRTLGELWENGIDPGTVEAAINTIEFRFRENNPGHFPRGLVLMLRSLTTWLYDKNPLALLRFEEPLARIKQTLRHNPRYFEDLIQKALLTNPHHTVLFLDPDPHLKRKEEQEEKERVSAFCASLTPEQTRALVKETLELKSRQQTPDPPEALARLPRLRLEDLDRKNKLIPLAEQEVAGTKTLFHDLFTNGIVYLDLGFDLHTIPEELLPYVPLFGRALVEMGTEKENYVSLGQRISQKTGGIHSECFSSPLKDKSGCTAWLFLRSKAMAKQASDLVKILSDMLLFPGLDNQKRFAEMVLEEKARTEQRLIPSGHQMVNLRLRSHFGEAYWLAEKIDGISYLFFLRDLSSIIQKNWPQVLDKLCRLRELLFNRNNMIVNVTLDQVNFSTFNQVLGALLDQLPAKTSKIAQWDPVPPGPQNEGLVIPSQVNYVGKGGRLYDHGYEFHGSALVVARYLRTSWLWDQVRVQGGAYGAFSIFDRLSGVMTFVSYRDPNLRTTLQAFDGSAQFLRKNKIPREELTKAIIGTIGDLDTHMLPDAKGFVSMLRYLYGDTNEARQQIREEILDTRPEHFLSFAETLDQMIEKSFVKVMGSGSAIEEANKIHPGWLEVIKLL